MCDKKSNALSRCGAQRSSVRGDARRVACTAGRRNARPLVDAGGLATTDRGDCEVTVRERRRPTHARCRGSAGGAGKTRGEHSSDIVLWVCQCSYSGWTTT